MPSYTTSLRLIQPSTGEYPGDWGNQVNSSLTAVVDKAVAGTATITMTAANYTLTNANGVADEAKSMFLVLQGTPGASYFVIVPTASKLYFVTNNTGFAQSVSTSTTPGSGISVPNGASMVLRCDGTNVVEALNAFGSIVLNGGTANGVAYLNASKALTTGSALVFDGSNLGLGVTPSAWGNLNKALQLSGTGAVSSTVAGNTASRLSHGAYFDNTNWRYTDTSIGAARYEMTGANGGSTHAWYVSAGGTAGNTISFTQAMTLDASGNLNLTSPATNIYIQPSTTTSNALIRAINAGGTAYIGLDTNAGGLGGQYSLNLWHSGAYPITFATNNTERARITSGGDFLVGTTNASVGTAVGCRIVDSGARLEVAEAATTNSAVGLTQYSTGAAAYRFYVGYGGTVYATSTTITAISDQRLKENIRDLDAGLSEVMALKPRKFDWKAGKGKDKKNDRGWIAQEFEQVFPDMVDTWQDPAPEGEEPYKAVNADLIPVLVKAVQEQQAIIEDLRARVAALEQA